MKLSMKTAWGENPALSYRNLRAITGYVGLTLPLVLLLTGAVDGHIESSLSAYYYTRVGDVFTGALCVIGIFLVAYRLTVWAIDNIATMVAGIAALGVAFFHAAPNNATLGQLRLADVHLICATVLFILLGAISLFIFPRDILLNEKWRVYWYMAFGALIWLSIILMPTLNWLARSFYDNNNVFFILETICVMAFAVSFILKGHGQPGNRTFDKMAERPPSAAIRPPAETPDLARPVLRVLQPAQEPEVLRITGQYPKSFPNAATKSSQTAGGSARSPRYAPPGSVSDQLTSDPFSARAYGSAGAGDDLLKGRDVQFEGGTAGLAQPR